MAGLVTKVAAGGPLRSSLHPSVGALDVLRARPCGDERFRRPQVVRRQRRQLRSIASVGDLRCDFASALPGANVSDLPSLAHGRPTSGFPCFNGHAVRRLSHSQTTTAESHQANDGNDASNRNQTAERRPKSDPTARRPTQKCDPYGLQGESLPYSQCLEWMSTLEDGWKLLSSEDGASAVPLESSVGDATTIGRPTFLQKQYYHPTLHEATKFMSHISLLATNLNHFPFLSVERILVDDINNIHGNTKEESDNGDGKRRRKVKGWVFRSIVRCSTYRPPTAGPSNAPSSTPRANGEGLHGDKGLTYHDFHLAMSIDVEVDREGVQRLLCSDSQG